MFRPRAELQRYLLAGFALWLCTITPSFGQKAAAKPNDSMAGAPIAATRRMAIDVRAFHRPLDAKTIRKWLQISSRCTMDEFELFLAPLTSQEQQLIEHIESMQAPIINRLPFADLRGVLKNGGLLSHEVEEQLNRGTNKHTTSQLENELYGAFDCVFASVGPPHGSPRYGDVIIRLKDSVRENGWATPFSGMHFLSAVRHQDAAKMQDMLSAGKSLPTDPFNPLSLGFDDRLHFSHYIVTEEHWNRALAYQAILVLRNADDSVAGKTIRERFEELLKLNKPQEFWTVFIPSREYDLPPEEAAAREPFGYLEGKFPDRFSIEDFTSIEVSAEQLEEVRSWPEAKPYLDLIQVKPAGVK